jgi:type II secretory pathway pseudopilin PulG
MMFISNKPWTLVVLVLVVGLLGGVYLFRWGPLTNPEKERRAMADLKRLEAAVRAYNTERGGFPACLEVLCEKEPFGPALLQESALTDPWGNPYIYEPQTLGHGGIWIHSLGPPNQNKRIVIEIK